MSEEILKQIINNVNDLCKKYSDVDMSKIKIRKDIIIDKISKKYKIECSLAEDIFINNKDYEYLKKKYVNDNNI